ncbi:hypothetical protein IT412_01930 [Candidatus Peregrinibacteria bacterium]|nr:hypothetical protein [Candidatus Peregrinibacteria bacterium]
MSHQQLPAHALHRDGHARTPGPDPRPRHRGSTEPQKVESTPTAAKQPKRRRGKKCGSSKPKYELAKAVLNLIFQQGQFELEEERRESKKKPLEEADSAENPEPQTLEQIVLKDLGMGKTPEADIKAMASKEEFFVVSFVVENGREVPLYRGSISGKILREEQLPASQQEKPLTQAEVSAKLKIREVLASLKRVRVTANLGQIVQVALKDPKLAKLLENYHPPSKGKPTLASREAFSISHQGQKPKSMAQKKLH